MLWCGCQYYDVTNVNVSSIVVEEEVVTQVFFKGKAVKQMIFVSVSSLLSGGVPLSSAQFFNLNFGPQHPAAHGVLRLILTLDGERVINADPHIGLLHRGTEKLLEFKTVRQASPYFDRLDYVSIIANEHGFCVVVEDLLNIGVSVLAQLLRVLFLELTRLLNHLIAITTHAMDVGRLTPFLWAFEEREKIIEIYEYVSGARMHANWIRPGGVATVPNLFVLCEMVKTFLGQFGSRLDEIEELLTLNRIWIKRTRDVGILTFSEAKKLGCTGVMLRSVGCPLDIRKYAAYECYSILPFMVPVGKSGDCYDRFVLRVYERRECRRIISLVLVQLHKCAMTDKTILINRAIRSEIKSSIERLIFHFKRIRGGFVRPYGEKIIFTEAPKGEFGVFLSADAGNRPYRVAIKSPGLFHLFATNVIAVNHYLADLVTIIGTQDIVFGEVDR